MNRVSLIYFDVDGVLNDTEATPTFHYHIEKVSLLLDIRDETGLPLVCCSFWRDKPDIRTLPFDFEVLKGNAKRLCKKDSIIIDDHPKLFLPEHLIYQTKSNVGLTKIDARNITTMIGILNE